MAKSLFGVFGYRAKDYYCTITDTVVRKMATLPLIGSLEPKIERCDIIDTVVKKMTTTFGNTDKEVVEHGKCRKRQTKI